ncbi:MAG TPA: TolC family protein [bacterium]|nr:TolC family protein [bacterium]
MTTKIINVIVLLIGALFLPLTAQQPITLERSLEVAVKNSPQIRRYQLNLERSQHALNARTASLKTQFSLNLTPLRFDQTRRFNDLFSTWYSTRSTSSSGSFTISQPLQWTDGTLELINALSWQDSYSGFQDITDKSYRNYLYVSYRQPIFTYNRTKLDLNVLELDLENSALNYAIQRLYLEYLVTQNFYSVYQKKSSMSVSIDEYQNRQQSYNIIKNKVEAGLAAKEELYQAELDLTSSKSKVQNAETDLDNALDGFKKLIGLSIFEDITVTADITHTPVEIEIEKALDTALKYRMELRQREIDIENARYDLLRASATNEFRGDVNLSYGIIGTDPDLKNVFDNAEKSQAVSIQFQIPFIDWGYRKSTIEAYKVSVQSRELSFEDQKNEILIEVRQAYRNLKNLVNQIEIAEQNVRNAQLTYDINLERYENGDITSMDLNLFQNQLSQAKMSKINALINYKLELLNMKVLSLYDFERNQRVVTDMLEASAISNKK